MRIITILLLACTGTQEQIPPADPEPEGPPTEADLIKKGPPEPGRFGRATIQLAEALDVGVARCPLLSVGRVTRIYGTPRDDLGAFGLEYLVEVGDDPIPWLVNYDAFPVEESWVTFLVTPGMTESYIQLFDRIVKLSFPAAERKQTTLCTSVEEVPKRVVRGSIEPRESEAFVVGCTEKPSPIAKDGTYVIDAEVPCTLWIETRDAYRSGKTQIAPGTEKLTLDPLPLELDTLQSADRSWTEEGLKEIRKSVLQFEDTLRLQSEVLDKAKQSLEGDPDAQDAIKTWQNLVENWKKVAKNTHTLIERGGEGL
ncbi:MAG TPA: hypothetical protein ENK18_11510 [Deltaproteobacteria bacterium]|nr:hypothetical protein [Deltaproteobacteria bacterium]